MEPATAPVVLTENLCKTFKKVTALDRLNLQIFPGEVLALLGANGSGKSTTFRLLLNVYRPSSGRASLLGRPCQKLDGADFDKIAYVSEGQKLPQWMTVQAHNEYCSRLYSEWDHLFCERLMNGFQLDGTTRIKFLSRGQRMKAALTSVLPARPRLLLLDEPFSGLDVETRAQLSELLRSLAREHDLTTIITTHDVEEVEPVASRLVILNRGRTEVDEPLDSFLSRHRRVRVRSFPGDAIPQPPIRCLPRKEVSADEAVYLTDNYTPDCEAAVRAAMPPGSVVDFEPVNLRAILAGKALQL